MISFISSLEIVNVAVPDTNIFLLIAASVADAAAVNLNGIKTLIVNGLSTYPIKGNQVFLVKVRKVYLKILLTVLFYPIEFLIISY